MKQNYIVQSPILHNHVRFGRGEKIELDEVEALALGDAVGLNLPKPEPDFSVPDPEVTPTGDLNNPLPAHANPPQEVAPPQIETKAEEKVVAPKKKSGDGDK